MSRRPGAVGRKTPPPATGGDLRDPADGREAPRCTECGVPGIERNGEWVTANEGHRFHRGLWVYLRFSVPDDRCDPCIRRRVERLYDPRAADPLQLHDAA